MKEGEYIAEYGGSVRFANMKAIDSDGNEIITPKCDKCQVHKNQLIGTEAFMWICPCCGV